MIKSFLTLFLLATAVFAQRAVIALPAFNQTVTAGSSTIVQVQQPDSLTNYDEVALVIGFQSCPNSACASPLETLGIVLYNGPFNPQFHENDLPPYENFTVQIPSGIPPGTAAIGAVHLELVGASFQPLLEALNQTIQIRVA